MSDRVTTNPDTRLSLCRLMEQSPLPMVSVEGTTHLVRYANPSFCRLADKTSEELIDRPFIEAVPEGKHNGCISLLDRVLVTGESEILLEQEHFQLGSYPVYWSYSVWAFRDEEGRQEGVMVQVTDATQAILARRQSAATLVAQEAQEQERAYVLSAARCMLYYADVTQSDHPDQLYWDAHFVDEAAAQAFLPLELEPGERYSQARYRSRHPEDRDRCDALGTRMIRAGKSYTQEFRSFCAGGIIRWIREDVQVETIVPGKSWRVVCVCTDITHMKDQQRALQKANEELILAGIRQHELRDAAESMNIRLQRAMTETHHRVKNNLQIIAAMVDIQVLEGTETLPTSAVKRLGAQVNALAALHDLLSEESKKDIEARSLDAFQVLSKLLSLLVVSADTTKITFRGDHAILAARQVSSLCLIANEIITNAIKHGRGSVDIAFNADERDAELIVEDNGPGFPEGFNPDTMSKNGLEMACHLARWDLSGSIAFETREGGGGRVTLKMPQFAQALLDEDKSAFASL